MGSGRNTMIWIQILRTGSQTFYVEVRRNVYNYLNIVSFLSAKGMQDWDQNKPILIWQFHHFSIKVFNMNIFLFCPCVFLHENNINKFRIAGKCKKVLSMALTKIITYIISTVSFFYQENKVFIM